MKTGSTIGKNKYKECLEELKKETKSRINEFIRLAEQDKSTTLDRIGDIIGNVCTTDIESDKAEHNMPETEKYFYRLTKNNN